MAKKDAPQDLEDLLGELDECAEQAGAKVSVQEIVDTVGRRSFGPLLLVSGLLGMTPVAAVPGAPSTLALITLLVATQLLFGRETIWLPRFLLRLSVSTAKLCKAVNVARKPARFVDRLVKPRLHVLTGPIADRLVALACTVLAIVTPPLELLPLVAFFPALAIAVFGLGLISRDGAVVLAGFLISGGALGFGLYQLLK